jgi:exopolysaccharide/PEP-CTERM locus tyrosine autokinase
MSTIEKAAARLAAGRAASPAVSQRKPALETPSIRRPVTRERAMVDVLPDDGLQTFSLDLAELGQRGFLVPGSSRSALAQQLRRLKRSILLNAQRNRVVNEYGLPGNLIAITSSLPGEGKTFTSINLSLSMAQELDHETLLVDADAARGDISAQLKLPARNGLTSLLARGIDYPEVEVLKTNVERLSVMPVGRPIEHVDELYASGTMKNIVHRLANEDPDRIVIFDCAPLLLATEVAVLARMVGQVLVVVEANRTPRDAVMRSLSMLEGCRNVNLILNKYGYGYGYGYGAFRTDAETPAQAVAREEH